jgi:hypothetical protein
MMVPLNRMLFCVATRLAVCQTGVLQYSATMPRPLLFLEPYIGDIAKDPQAFKDIVQPSPV